MGKTIQGKGKKINPLKPNKTDLEKSNTVPVKKPVNRVNLEQAFKLRMRGATYQDIANKQGVTASSVQSRLEGFLSLVRDPSAITTYRENEAEILDGTRWKLIKSIAQKADDEKASVNNLAYAFTQVNQAQRLIRQQSTSNESLHVIVEQANREQLGVSTHQAHTPTDKPLISDHT